jgi:aldehyde dehydrogenase (NAD+)
MTDSILPEVHDFLAQNPLGHFIGGAFRASADGSTQEVLNPSDGTPLAIVSMGGAPEVSEAVSAANHAFPAWASIPVTERAATLRKFADLLEARTAVLAQIESLDVGKAITASEAFDIPFGTEAVRYFAELSLKTEYRTPLSVPGMEAYVQRAPYGVCGFIVPWNFPFDLLLWGVAPALAAGNTVVVKPSEVTPLSALYMAQLAIEAGLPAGVFNVVVGLGTTVGTALVQNPGVRFISFTGSPEVGSKVGAACGSRVIPCKLELGGKGAALVFADADIRDAAQKLVGALTLNTGQVCCTATRWIVEASVFDAFVEEARAAFRDVKIGPALDRSTTMGPLVSEVQRKRVTGYLEKGRAEGGRILVEPAATPSSKGFYAAPWLMEAGPENVCFREEIFGPAACVTRFFSEQEAIDLVNHLDYGLANSVWSSDLTRARRVAEALVSGNAWINAHNVFAYGLPYGGVNRSGLGGGVNSPETFHDYLRGQTVARPL